MSLTSSLVLLLAAAPSLAALIWLGVSHLRFVQRACGVCDRILKQRRFPDSDWHRVFFCDVRFLRRRFRRRRFQGAGIVYLNRNALALHGELPGGEPFEVTLPRRELRVQWAGRAPVPSDRSCWVRVTSRDRCLFFCPAGPATAFSKTRAPARDLHAALGQWSGASVENPRSGPDLSKPGKVASALAVLVILGVVAGIYGLVDSARTLSALAGPSDLALSPDGRIVVVENQSLHVLDAGGARIESVPLARLGIDGFVRDLHFADDGRLYLAHGSRGIRRCRMDGWICDTLAYEPGVAAPLRTYKFALDEPAGRILVTDAARHQISVFTMDGQHVHTTRGEATPLCFPNAIVVDRDGSVLVADTNNHRVVAFDPAIETQLRPRWSLYTADVYGSERTCHNTSRLLPEKSDAWLARALDFEMTGSPKAIGVAAPGRVWPTEVKRDRQGRLWVINARGDMSFATLLRYETRHAAPQAIELGEGSDPTALLALEDAMIVADFFGFALLRIGEDGRAESFARGEYAGELERKRERYARARSLRTLCVGALFAGLFLVLAICLAHTELNRRRALAWTPER